MAVLTGGDLPDWLVGSDGADRLSGLGGADTLSGDTGNDTLLGGQGNDDLRGGAGDDTLDGGAGDDFLDGHEGNDMVVYRTRAVGDHVTAANGHDTLWGGADTVLQFGNLPVGHLVLSRNLERPDDLLLRITDTESNQGSNSKIVGSINVIDMMLPGPTPNLSRIDLANATILFDKTASALTARIHDAVESLTSTIVWGIGGDDLLQGSSADENFRPGVGDDTVVGNGGYDVVSYEDNAPDGITVDLRLANGQVTDASGGSDTLIDIDKIIGSDRADLMIGGGGNDGLEGAAGDDTVEGLAGNDFLSGNAGFDTVSYGNATAGVVVRLVNGGDGSASGGDGNDLLFGFEAVTGSRHADALTGNAAANLLIGGAGNDTLDGGAGYDTLRGGNGNDDYRVNAAGDVIVETADGGTDLVRSSAPRTLGAHQENLTLIGTATVNGSGNNLANRVAGNNAANGLNGAGGHDQLLGQGGNDILNGAAGNDTLTGGAGADLFRFTAALNGATNVDAIADFDAAADRIELGATAFAGIGPAGGLAAGAFALGSTASEADDRVLYDSASGELRYDADGSGAGAAVLFATLVPGTVLTAADIVVI